MRKSGQQQKIGAAFENSFEAVARAQRIVVTRMPDGCRVVGKNRLLRVKTPCDWIVTYNGRTALLDTKTCEEGLFPHSRLEEHQLSEMLKHEEAGGIGGYVIFFRAPNVTKFFPCSVLKPKIGVRGSIAFDSTEGIELARPGVAPNLKLIFDAVDMSMSACLWTE